MYALSALWEPWAVRKPGWFEINVRRLGFAAELIYTGRDDDYPHRPWILHFHILWLNVYVNFPGPHLQEPPKTGGFYGGQWGFSWPFLEEVHLHWGETSVKSLPWMYEQVRHEVKLPDDTWAPHVGSWEHDKEPDGRETFTYPYHYIRENGDVQERTAEVYVERRARRPRGWTRSGLFERVREAIRVRFSDEVGERTGSWKGGCIGCGWDLRDRETPLHALRRMEQERKF